MQTIRQIILCLKNLNHSYFQMQVLHRNIHDTEKLSYSNTTLQGSQTPEISAHVREQEHQKIF